MTDEYTTSRITRVESDLADLRRERREEIKGLHEKMDAVIATVASLSSSQGIEDVRVQGEISNIKAHLCPRPGACLDITPRLDRLEDKFGILHDSMQQLKGGGKVISGIWGAIGASVVAAVIWVLTQFLHSGKP